MNYNEVNKVAVQKDKISSKMTEEEKKTVDFPKQSSEENEEINISDAVKDEAEVPRQSSMSHQEALATFEATILDLTRTDPLLNYLPPDITLEELNSLLALEHGRAMTVVVRRADEICYSVVVEQKATVLDLKKAIQRHVTLKQARSGGQRTISWRTSFQSHTAEESSPTDNIKLAVWNYLIKWAVGAGQGNKGKKFLDGLAARFWIDGIHCHWT